MNPPDPTGTAPLDSGDVEEIQRALESLTTGDSRISDPDIRIDVDYHGRDSGDDDRFLMRFYGICILLIGLATIVPCVFQWAQMAQADRIEPVPRWVYLLGFAGLLHVLYAVFLIQVFDYSAVQSVAAFLLVVTCVYGFLVVSLLLGDANGNIPLFLQLPLALQTRAAIWCGLMSGISALGCYLLGREAIVYRRRRHAGRILA